MPHKALCNDDIIREIVGQLSAEYQLSMMANGHGFAADCPLDTLEAVAAKRSGSKEALVACTRVSKAFAEPALRGLWRKLEKITPLLSLFSSFEICPHIMYNEETSDEDSSDSGGGDAHKYTTAEEAPEAREEGGGEDTANESAPSAGEAEDHTTNAARKEEEGVDAETEVAATEGVVDKEEIGEGDESSEDEEEVNEETALTLRADVPDEEWGRFQYYAKRVRALRITDDSQPQIDLSVFLYLLRRNDGQPLLPILEELFWVSEEITDTSLMALLTPSLRSFTLTLTASYTSNWDTIADEILDHTLHCLLTIAPRLQALKLHGIVTPVRAASITSWKDLRELQLVNRPHQANAAINSDYLRALASMEHLTDLWLYVKLEPTSSLATVDFPYLQRLTVFGTSPHATHFLKAVAIPQLVSFHFQSWFSLTFDDTCSTLCSVVVSKFPRLRSFDFSELYCFPSDETLYFSQFIEPLFALRDLESVSMQIASMDFPAVMTNKDLRLIGTAWPKLRRLWVNARGFVGYRVSGPTVDGLVELFDRCPDLRELDLPDIDFRTLINLPFYRILSNKLVRLNMLNEYLMSRDLHTSARFIRDSFPNLDLIGLLNSDDTSYPINIPWRSVLVAASMQTCRGY